LTNVAEGLSAAAPRRGHGRKTVMTDTGSPAGCPTAPSTKTAPATANASGLKTVQSSANPP